MTSFPFLCFTFVVIRFTRYSLLELLLRNRALVNFSVHNVGETICCRKIIVTFLMVSKFRPDRPKPKGGCLCLLVFYGNFVSKTQNLGKIVMRTPVVSAKIWCLFFYHAVRRVVFETVSCRVVCLKQTAGVCLQAVRSRIYSLNKYCLAVYGSILYPCSSFFRCVCAL